MYTPDKNSGDRALTQTEEKDLKKLKHTFTNFWEQVPSKANLGARSASVQPDLKQQLKLILPNKDSLDAGLSTLQSNTVKRHMMKI